MPISSLRSLNLVCIVCYLLFMGLAIDSQMVDALVFYVSEQDGKPIYSIDRVETRPVAKDRRTSSPVMAVQVRSEESSHPAGANDSPTTPVGVASSTGAQLVLAAKADIAPAESEAEGPEIETASHAEAFKAPPADAGTEEAADDEGEGSEDGPDNQSESATAHPALPAPLLPTAPPTPPAPATALLPQDEVAALEMDWEKNPSISNLVKVLPLRPWFYNPLLDRYVVRYDTNTTIVLTLRPSLQRMVEEVFRQSHAKLGVGIIQDPLTGAILALTSYDGHQVLSPDQPGFRDNNWAFRATFPVASIFKIITASAGIEKRQVVPTSLIRIGRRATLELWRAFAKSHNGVFGVVGRSVGRGVLQSYANAFGFNKPFYFDLPVTPSVAHLPETPVKLGEAAAGLNKQFLVSPLHVASIVSTVLNRGRMMKPYLVDYVLHRNKVVYRRKPFPLSQPISSGVALQIYEMMRTTTTHGTAKNGFAGHTECPNLADLCGGKTGTLTGVEPHLLFTWFGGFTRAAGRDLSITFLCGQQGRSRVKATTLAAKASLELLNRIPPAPAKVASR